MAARLRYLGLVLLAGAAWFILAGEFGWVDKRIVEVWFAPFAWAGGVGFVLGLVLQIFSGVGRRLQQYRCVRCGAPTGRNETYCRDHLQETMHEYQDQTRQRAARR